MCAPPHHRTRSPDMTSLAVPPGFVAHTNSQETWWLKAGYESLVLAVVQLLAEEQQQRTADAIATRTVTPLRWGRGYVWRVQTDPQGAMIVRYYRRGGFVRHFVSDIYWDQPPRPLAELVCTEMARQRGVPTIEVLGAQVRWITRRLYRGVFVSQEVEGFHNLWEWLQTRPTGPTRVSTLTAVARTIRTMHDAGIVHADLNLTNILVQAGTASSQVCVLDFDRARLFPSSVARAYRERTLARLQRSLHKLNPDGSLFSAADLALLCSEPSP